MLNSIIYSIGSRLIANPLVTLALAFTAVMGWGLVHMLHSLGL